MMAPLKCCLTMEKRVVENEKWKRKWRVCVCVKCRNMKYLPVF